MLLIVYNEAMEEELMQALDDCGIDCFTKWEKVLGKGRRSPPRLATEVWPGTNNVCMVVEEERRIKPLLEKIKILRRELASEGIKAFLLPVEEVA